MGAKMNSSPASFIMLSPLSIVLELMPCLADRCQRAGQPSIKVKFRHPLDAVDHGGPVALERLGYLARVHPSSIEDGEYDESGRGHCVGSVWCEHPFVAYVEAFGDLRGDCQGFGFYVDFGLRVHHFSLCIGQFGFTRNRPACPLPLSI